MLSWQNPGNNCDGIAALSVEKGSAVEQAGRAGVWGRFEEALFQTGDCLSSEPDEILIYQVPHTVADR